MKEMTEPRRDLVTGTALLAAFVLWTALVQLVGVQLIGQNGTLVSDSRHSTYGSTA